MEEVKKIAKINIIILLIYSIVILGGIRLISHDPGEVYGILILMTGSIIIHVLVNLILAAKIFSKDPEKIKLGKAHLLNCLIILLIGFPTCLAGVGYKI